jgi:hypothetical protein
MAKKDKKLAEEKTEEVFELEDGTIVKKWCLNRLSDGISNYEAIWDVLDVVTKITKLKIAKNKDGLVTNVDLVLPNVNEVVAQIALRNFTTYHSIRLNDPDITSENLLDMRRTQLQKTIESRGSKT